MPISLAGGFVVGYLIYLIIASQAARPDAPIVYIADFAGSLASNLVSFYLAYEVAPDFKSRVVAASIVLAVVASAGAVYLFLQRDAMIELIGVAGNLVACFVGWRKYVSVPRRWGLLNKPREYPAHRSHRTRTRT